jgi:hypothetical protein
MTADGREVYHPRVPELPPPPEHVAHVPERPPPPEHVAHVPERPPPPPEHVAHVPQTREIQEMADRLRPSPPDRRLRRVPRKKVTRGVVVVVALAITIIVSGVYAYMATRSDGGTTTEAAPVESAPVETAFVEAGTDCEESAIATMPADEAGACLRQIAGAHGYAVDPQLGAFTASYNACSASSIEELAAEFGTDPFAPIVAQAYAADLYGPEAQQASLDGCFLALT